MSVFTALHYATQFRAIGVVKGCYRTLENKLFLGTLVLDGGVEVRARLLKPLRKKVANDPELLSKLVAEPYLWKIYPRTDERGCLQYVDIKNYHPLDSLYEPVTNIIEVRGLIKNLEINDSSFAPEKAIGIEVRPNQSGRGGRRLKPFTVVVTGEVPVLKKPKHQFWECNAQVVAGVLKYQSGYCVSSSYGLGKKRKSSSKSLENKEPIETSKKGSDDNHSLLNNQHSSDTIPKTQLPSNNEKAIATSPSNAELNKSQLLSTSSEIIMVSGRIPELSIKFTTRLELPEQGKKVTLQVNGENGIAVRATFNRRTLKKQVDKMDRFPEWVGVLSGAMQGIGEDGVIELSTAGITVFEKKSKKPDAEKQNSEAQAKQPSVEKQQADAEKQKSDAEQKQSDSKETVVELKQADAGQKQSEVESKKVEAKQKQSEVEPKQVEAKQKQSEVEPKQVEAEQKQSQSEPKQVEAEQKQSQSEQKEVETEQKQVEAKSKQKQDADEAKQVEAKLKQKQDPESKQPDSEPLQVDDKSKKVEAKQKESQSEPLQADVEPKKVEAKQKQTEAKQKQSDDEAKQVESKKVEAKQKQADDELKQAEAKQKESQSEPLQVESKKVEPEQKQPDVESLQVESEPKQADVEASQSDAKSKQRQSKTKSSRSKAKKQKARNTSKTSVEKSAS